MSRKAYYARAQFDGTMRPSRLRLNNIAEEGKTALDSIMITFLVANYKFQMGGGAG
jgi:hypothetical protein